MTNDLQNRAIDTLRFLSADAVQKANSGHPGMPMGMADIAVTLWGRYLNVDPDNPDWPDRDRFVLSNGHGSMLLYSVLHLSGFPMTLDDIKNFRKLNYRTPGHPENFVTEGIETTTGPLGQGLANIADQDRRDLAPSGDDAPTRDQRDRPTSGEQGHHESGGRRRTPPH